jgi:serine/threonine protein kinase/Flp pilus assembly protein TadD
MSAARFGSSNFPSRSGVHWPSESTLRRDPDESWVSREVDAMAAAWSRGQRVSAAEIINRSRGIADEAAVRLIYEEVNLRRESGEDVLTTEVVARYPRWKDELEVLLGCDRMLRPLMGPAELPEVGEYIGPFSLKAEIGRGASGRTYLATEPTLADRPVVLKVISDDQEEHLSLARLQHTNIIPLFSEHTFPERRLRVLCMPYLGGTSLARVLDALAPIPPADRRGRDIIHALDRVQAAGAGPAPVDGPYRRNLENVSYVDAVCWIGTRLADALQEAHTHGLVHMDVKPSNVLIAADGSPMLLDFHLARRPLGAGERFPGRIGGTPGWMAPEHRAALDAVVGGQTIPEPLDHRADIYGLGLLLRESLNGVPAPDGGGSLRACNPGVSVGLEDIINRCLAIRPADRYPSAASLAGDLRRHLEHLPLRGVPNRSPHERWRKWRRRRPSALGHWAIWISSACLALIIAGGWLWIGQQASEARADLREGQALCNGERYDAAEHPLRLGLERAEMFPGQGQLVADLRAQLRVAHRGQRADALHRLAEQVRYRYGIDPPAGAEAHALLRNMRTIWDDRHLLLAREWAPLASKIEDKILADLPELVATWADVRTRLAAPSEARRAQEEALAMLEEARSDCGPSFTIDRLRRSLAQGLGRATSRPDEESAPRTAHDNYELGRSLLRDGDFQAAAEQFRLSLDQRPDEFWPNFYLGRCEYHSRRFDEAVAAFGICIALEPKRAECYFNRAMAAEALGRSGDALRDYDKALNWNADLTSALLNRGILHYNMSRYADAITDLRHASETTTDPKTLGRIHYNLALIHLGRGDRASAGASADRAIAMGDEEAWDLRDRLRHESAAPATLPER